MPTKPREVNWAVSLQFAALALGAVATALDWNHLKSLGAIPKLVLLQVAVTLLLGYVIWRISAGKNWARITCLVLFLFGLPSFVINARADFARSAVLGAVIVFEALMEGTALWLLFIAPAKYWFTTLPSVSPPSTPSMRRPVGVNEFLCSYLRILTFSPSRLCRHPSIRSLC